jgi:diguanylate cyclase (GGDEF)-like protein
LKVFRASPVSLRLLVSTIGLVIALIAALAIPIGVGTSRYLDHAAFLSFKARLGANRVARYVYSHGELWQYQQLRIAEILLLPEDQDEPFRQRVIDASNAVVVEEGPALSGLLLRRDAPILVNGAVVGRVETEASLTPFLIAMGWVTFFSFALGGAVYFVLRVLPLRVLDRTVGELETQNHRFDAALSNMTQGLIMFDAEQRLVVCNQRYQELYDIPDELARPGATLDDILNCQIASEIGDGADPGDYKRKLLSFVLDDDSHSAVFELASGRAIAIKRNRMPHGGWIATHEDVTEQRDFSVRLAYIAHHDGLTDLPNRLLLRERLNEALNRMKPGETVAVLCLDLDHFKNVNDSLGHSIGDALLKQVAERLRHCIREGDTVARMGGDEFAIVQVGAVQPMAATALASRLIDELGAPYSLDGHNVVTSTSVGVAISPSDGTDSDHLLKSADLALYRAKEEGRGTHRFFESEMNERMQARRELEVDLRRAIVQGEFELYYQPLVNLCDNQVAGFEALLRWNHPERGRVLPADFIPLAEEIGLIVPIGEWVLRQACSEAAGWPNHVKVAVNLSPVQFKGPAVVQSVLNALASSGLAPSRLELEITESVLLENTTAALAMLHQLRGLGVSIAMDDFGTGYSSLSYLQSFPFDKIKVDRSFISGLGQGASSHAILRAVASLGTSLCIATTAEGVETEAQLAEVRAEGITQIQGYLISPPKSAEDVARSFLPGSVRRASMG